MKRALHPISPVVFKSLGNKITNVIAQKCGALLPVSEAVHVHTAMDTSTCSLGHFKQRAVHLQLRKKFCFLIPAIWN